MAPVLGTVGLLKKFPVPAFVGPQEVAGVVRHGRYVPGPSAWVKGNFGSLAGCEDFVGVISSIGKISTDCGNLEAKSVSVKDRVPEVVVLVGLLREASG